MLNRNVFIYLFAYMAPAAIGFFSVALYTHLLTPGQYGHYVIGMSLAGIVNMLCFVWIRLSVSRYQASSPDLDLRGTAILGYLCTVGVIAALSPLAILLATPEMNLSLIAGAVFMALAASAFEIGQEFRRAKQEPLRFTAVAVLRSLLSLGLAYGAIRLGFGGVGLLVALAASYAICSPLQFGLPGKTFRLIDRGQFVCFARYGLPLSLGGLAFALYSSGDRLIVAYLLGPDAAGKYGVSADLSRQFILIMAQSCASATIPIVFRALASNGPQAARDHLNNSLELLLAVIAPVAVWLAVSADVFASVMLGPEFRLDVPVILPLLVTARLFGAISQFHLHLSFQLAERPLLQVLHEILNLVAGLLLMVPLTLGFGLTGAAAGTLLTEACALTIGWLLSRCAFAMPIEFGRIGCIAAATAALAVAAFGAKEIAGHAGLAPLIAVFLAGALAYGGVAYALNVARIRTSLTRLIGPYLVGWRARASFRS